MKRKRKARPFNPPKISRELEVILETKALRMWVSSLDGCLKFLLQLNSLKKGKQEAWVLGNREYQLKRIHKLLDNVPEGASKVATKARSLIEQLESE